MTDNSIKLIALDFDGVVSDGFLYLTQSGEEIKRVAFRDVMGISRARKAGLKFAIVSGESSLVLSHFASRLGIELVIQGCSDKWSAIQKLAQELELSLEQVGFMGDDINDLEAMRFVGVSAAPRNAHSSAIEIADFVTPSDGGQGAVRDFLEFLKIL